MLKESPQSISISTGTLIRAMLVFLFFVFLFYVRDVLLVVLTAVVIASSIEPLTVWLKRFRIPRLIAVISTYIVLSTVFIGVFYFFVPSLLSDTANFLRAVPTLLESVPTHFAVEPTSVLESANLAETLSQGIENDLGKSPTRLSGEFTGQALSFWILDAQSHRYYSILLCRFCILNFRSPIIQNCRRKFSQRLFPVASAGSVRDQRDLVDSGFPQSLPPARGSVWAFRALTIMSQDHQMPRLSPPTERTPFPAKSAPRSGRGKANSKPI